MNYILIINEKFQQLWCSSDLFKLMFETTIKQNQSSTFQNKYGSDIKPRFYL